MVSRYHDDIKTSWQTPMEAGAKQKVVHVARRIRIVVSLFTVQRRRSHHAVKSRRAFQIFRMHNQNRKKENSTHGR